ncbi:NADPH:quinone reductase [Streptomyces avermitilis]|uniref:Dehydrogenase n=2 Tax=Streptomyces avermitilis TaxID=33903 RepID=Q82E57_STRAW|nr:MULTISPECIES: NADP-dependent oxidoreductase [Streptomyces]KUN52458.1 NADPH:quinone reductase [Streptomyces avermitilis]MYT00344.1 zinc-binding dehydrogenase [Streptomyces sp. SID5469]OOV31478.1 NADPH:quinone reductase [Streptomyces avermitilis]BAC72471.1 putative dehydrogenase [Streptomyces avermitilis MA-4680 = NBRC 14893]BBJ52822.1 NADPH:quinone reductase [Streptomyces avermitilis]
MRAVVVTSFGGPEAVEIVETGVPEPAARQVRIKVAAAALNPVDAGVRSGVFGGAGKRLGLGWDVAGTIDAVGVATGWTVGEEVVALAYGAAKSLGTHADYVVVDADAVAKAPVSVDAVHAATVPLNALTAAQALDLLALEPGQRLLVTGAAGAVGGYAAHRGIAVTALAREADAELVRSLGAAESVTGPVAPGSVDAVLDAAILGAAALEWVRDGGAFAGVIPQAQPASERGVRTGAVEVSPDGARLAELVALVDEGVLTPRVAETYALAEVAKAHARLAEGGLRGRVVLIP